MASTSLSTLCVCALTFVLIHYAAGAAITKASAEKQKSYGKDLEVIHRQQSTETCSCASGPRIRKEASSMTTSEWNSFVQAFRALKDTNDGLSTFERFVDQHRRFQRQAHSGVQFLPWHREYLFQVECRLRRINPSVTIPYWDWSIDASDLALSPLWGRVGGARRDRPIPNSPFRGWSSSVETQHLIVRGFNSGRRGSITVPVEDAATIRSLQRDASLSFSEFSSSLEVYHNAPHGAVGGSSGDMSRVALSPNDPVFYLHHAFIDKIWYEWQRNPGKSREYNGSHRGRQVALTDRIQPWNGTAENLFARDECVSYEQPSRAGVPGTQLSTIQAVSTRGDESKDPRESLFVKEVYKKANAFEKKKLDQADPRDVKELALRFKKNQWYREWARKNGFPLEKVAVATKVAAKEDKSVDTNAASEG